MTLTTYPSATDSSDLAILNLSRLLTRLEHNLLSPNANLKFLRQSEYHRMRVNANIEYARNHLQALERSLPKIKPVDRRHEIGLDLTHNRQTLKRLQNTLGEIQAAADFQSARTSTQHIHTPLDTEDDESDFESMYGEEDLLATPEGDSTADEGNPEDLAIEPEHANGQTPSPTPVYTEQAANPAPPTSTTATTTMRTSTSGILSPTRTLRNRHHAPSAPTTTATSTSFHDSHLVPTTPSTSPQLPGPASKAQSAEQALASDRLEQENLTSSLLSLATQLKTSSNVFHASLESEKSVLARAVDGLDRTTGNMQAAEQRMGMLRRMTEGKGWWGRMMLYAWIFGLWIVAVLLVFLGPKLRF